MSLQQWIHLRYGIDIPWKTFIRESAGVRRDKSPERRVHLLTFRGSEARVAYEEVIGCQQDNNGGGIVTRSSKCLRARSAAGQGGNSGANPSSVLLGAQSGRTSAAIPEDVLAKVTINALLKAVEQKDLKFLQKHMTSENVNASDDFGWTPLMSAAYCGHLEIVQFLLNLGANRRIRDRSGLTAAQLALKKNYLSIVALLKKKSESMGGGIGQSCAGTPRVSGANACSVRPVSIESSRDHERDARGNAEERAQPQQNAAFYCDVCKAVFQETTPRKHETSTLHVFNTKPKLKHAMYGISRQNKGYKMLLNTGWDEEAGLGPSGKGMKYPLKTCLKTDRKGLGSQPVENEYRVTHFKAGDAAAVNSSAKAPKQKPLKKRDRERLLHREARKERALRIALS